MNSINITFLIIAHKNESQVARLVSMLESPNSVSFIHVDRDSKMDVSKLRGGGAY